jgi:hypothetical protein
MSEQKIKTRHFIVDEFPRQILIKTRQKLQLSNYFMK